MIKIKCIKEDSSFTLGKIYTVKVDLSDVLYHLVKYETSKDAIVELYGDNDLSEFCSKTYAMSNVAVLKYEDYVADDFTCWYNDEWFKEHFIVL